MLAAGHIQQLYEEMMNQPKQRPSKYARKADVDEWNELTFGAIDQDLATTFNPSAQRAADRDNLQAAFQRLDDSLPVALNTDTTVNAITTKLYPPRSPTCPYPRNTTRKHASTPIPLLPKDQDLIAAVKKIKTGTSSGPFADSTDLLRSFVLTAQRHNNPDKEYVYPNLSLFREYITILHAGNVPDDILAPFGSQYFLALHKSVEDDEKLRPIGIGTHARRVLGTMEVYAHAADFAHTLWPFQYGIALSAGMQFLTHAMQALLYKFLPGSSSHTSSSRALLQLDLRNMFNAVSRDSCRHALLNDPTFQDLIPTFDLLYFRSNTCWYQRPDGSWDSFNQNEGFTQGCPLSPFFACRVLHILLKDLHSRLTQRAANRLCQDDPGDDGFGSRPALGAYIDDSNGVLPFADLPFTLDLIEELGPQHGLYLNYDKTKILFSCDPTITNDDPHLLNALQRLKPDNRLTNGTIYLGTPLGSSAFIEQHLSDAADKFDISRRAIQNQLADSQTQLSLFCKCLQASIPHLLATDVILRANTTTNTQDPFNWSSPFISRLQTSTTNFLAYLSGHHVDKVRPDTLAWLICHFPLVIGGLGFHDYAARAIPSFIVPFARSLRHAQEGFCARNSDTILKVPVDLACALLDWKHSNAPSLAAFRSLTPPTLANQRFRNVADVTSHLVEACDLRTLLRDIVRDHKKEQCAHLLRTAPPAIASLLPSLLTRSTSDGLISMSRTHPDQRLTSPYFRIQLCRKLHLPVYLDDSLPRTCGCGTTIDEHGDHFFTCTRHNKSMMSNQIRDALHLICSETGPHAGIIRTRSDVTTEPTNLAHENPTSRPADVCINLAPTYAVPPLSPFTKAAIDVTITGPLPVLSDGDSSIYTASVTKHHLKAERDKFRGRDITASGVMGENIIRALNASNTVLLPFSVDPLGGLGPSATWFLAGMQPASDLPTLTFQSPTAQQAYNNAISDAAPHGILRQADKNWNHTSSHLPFGSTYHGWFPSTWARQTLGANINHAFASHIYHGMHKSYSRSRSNDTCPHPLAIGRYSRYPLISHHSHSQTSTQPSRSQTSYDSLTS